MYFKNEKHRQAFEDLSGNGNITLYSDSLTDGEYAFEYTCNYKSGFLGLVTTNYSYKFGFEVDKSTPVYSDGRARRK